MALSEALSGTPMPSHLQLVVGLFEILLFSGHQWPSVAISGHQWPSVAISGHQWPSHLQLVVGVFEILLGLRAHLALLTIGVAQLAVEVRQLRELGEELGLSRKCLVQDLALLT